MEWNIGAQDFWGMATLSLVVESGYLWAVPGRPVDFKLWVFVDCYPSVCLPGPAVSTKIWSGGGVGSRMMRGGLRNSGGDTSTLWGIHRRVLIQRNKVKSGDVTAGMLLRVRQRGKRARRRAGDRGSSCSMRKGGRAMFYEVQSAGL